jgi:hypothetical protein
LIGIGGSDRVQDPAQTRPADTASTSQHDRLAGHQAHLIPLTRARLGIREPEPAGRLRADALDALGGERTLTMRWASDAETLAHEASIVPVAAALSVARDTGADRPPDLLVAADRPDLVMVDFGFCGRARSAPT